MPTTNAARCPLTRPRRRSSSTTTSWSPPRALAAAHTEILGCMPQNSDGELVSPPANRREDKTTPRHRPRHEACCKSLAETSHEQSQRCPRLLLGRLDWTCVQRRRTQVQKRGDGWAKQLHRVRRESWGRWLWGWGGRPRAGGRVARGRGGGARV